MNRFFESIVYCTVNFWWAIRDHQMLLFVANLPTIFGTTRRFEFATCRFIIFLLGNLRCACSDPTISPGHEGQEFFKSVAQIFQSHQTDFSNSSNKPRIFQICPEAKAKNFQNPSLFHGFQFLVAYCRPQISTDMSFKIMQPSIFEGIIICCQ